MPFAARARANLRALYSSRADKVMILPRELTTVILTIVRSFTNLNEGQRDLKSSHGVDVIYFHKLPDFLQCHLHQSSFDLPVATIRFQ